ncbi:Fic family protein [Dyadobacter aurulentus]|uniref:Fic family protein n=1 Tax=Dyadobacter sp. UC 10 TaxID=2605428 RepID=UPI0011F212EF|nr:Fic family protein [Dyadobacter sp. UC 10]KAA0992236.1 Fic family protein [Dyadobacter sp. UC 10]
MYIHQRREWPSFTWNSDTLLDILGEVRNKQGRLVGKMENLGVALREEAVLESLTTEVLKSNEIEGEFLDADQVRSSIALKLGMNAGGVSKADRSVEGVVDVMLDATTNYQAPLSADRMFGWHAALFPTGRSGMSKITTAAWRDVPMQVVSGGMGREQVHFEAPAADKVPGDMDLFINWFNKIDAADPVLKAGIAHLWFVTIHPFDDGNGRLARTIADMQLARSDKSSQRFYSMSAQIRIEREAYYEILEKTQRSDELDITAWLKWFLLCFSRALNQTENLLENVIQKAEYWSVFNNKTLNDRQRLMLNKLMDGFEGKLNSSKWAKMTKTSHDTALRDIQGLVDQQVLVQESSGGRSTSYRLIELPEKQ